MFLWIWMQCWCRQCSLKCERLMRDITKELGEISEDQNIQITNFLCRMIWPNYLFSTFLLPLLLRIFISYMVVLCLHICWDMSKVGGVQLAWWTQPKFASHRWSSNGSFPCSVLLYCAFLQKDSCDFSFCT